MDLTQQKCGPCSGATPKLADRDVKGLLHEVKGWSAHDEKIHKQFVFKNFVEAITFVDQMAAVAESEGHHPNFCVNFNKVDVTIWTHAIGGLSENDFILAAKLDRLA